MSLEQGVRYIITANESTKFRRASRPISEGGDFITQQHTLIAKGQSSNPIMQFDAPQINYVLDTYDNDLDIEPNNPLTLSSSSVSDLIPDFSLSSDKLFDSNGNNFGVSTLLDYSSVADITKLGHNELSFFGAPQTTFKNVLHNELFSSVTHNIMYLLQGAAEIKSGSSVHTHGSIFTATSTAPTRVSGSPVLVEVYKHGKDIEDSDVVDAEGEAYARFYVYGDQAAIDSGVTLSIGGSAYYPGDIVSASSGTVNVSTSTANVALVPSSTSDNVNLFRLFWKDNSIDLSSAEDGVSYLVYDNIACVYSGSTLKTAPHSNNVFKTTNDDIYTQPSKLDANTYSLSRKKPIIREIVKSGDIEAGETYLLFQDRTSGFGRVNSIKYNNITYSSEVGTNMTSFVGAIGEENYEPSNREFDKTDQDKDPNFTGSLVASAKDVDISSGNVMVIKKEPIGLKSGEKYVLVAEAVSSIDQDVYYILSAGTAIEYNDVRIDVGEVFKGTTRKTWSSIFNVSDGNEEVTRVTNEIQVSVGDSAPYLTTYTTTIKNRKVEFTPSDSNASLMIQWKKTSGKPYVYPVVSTVEKNKKYFVAAEGDGRIIYPNLTPKYRCLSPFKSDEIQEELTSAQLVYSNNTFKKCVDEGGRWVLQDQEFIDTVEELGNRQSFHAIKGKCTNSNGEEITTAETEDNCVDPVDGSTSTTWTPYTQFTQQKDSLNIYASASTADLALPIQVIFNEDNATALTPKDTSNVSNVNINVLALTYPLKAEQVIRFPQQSADSPLPCFIVKQDAEIGDTEINGILLYDSVASNTEDINKRTGTLSLETSNSEVDANGVITSSSECYYYAEPVEIVTVSSSVNEADNATVTFDSLPVEFAVGELIVLEHSSGNSQLKVSSYNSSAKTITGKLRCPHGSNLPIGAKAKLVGKKVGYYSVNQSFEAESTLEAVTGKPVVRFKTRTLLTPVTEQNIETLEAATGELREIVAQGSSYSSFDLAAGTYTLRGRGFVTISGEDYYPASKGRIKIDHESGSGSYYEAGDDNTSESGAAEATLRIENSPLHAPVGSQIVFSGGTLTTTEKLNVGDRFLVGTIDGTSASGKIYHEDQSNEVTVAKKDPPALNSTTLISLGSEAIVCKNQAVAANSDPHDNNGSRPEKYYNVAAGKSYFVEAASSVYADYFSSVDILSGNKFKINKLIDEQRTNKTKLNFGDINGSEARYDHEAKGESFIYMLPTSPMPHIESFGKVYKVTHEYKEGSESFNIVDNNYTYKVGGKGEGYVAKSSSNYDIGQTFTGTGQATLVPSSPTVYEKKTTTLEPNKYYLLDAPENYNNSSSITNLTTVQYNGKKYFADTSHLEDSNQTIKYNNTTYNIRHFNLSSYVFGRADTPFLENVRNYNEGLGKLQLKKIEPTGKTAVELSSNYRFFDIILNSFENFNILRRDKYNEGWGHYKLSEQQTQGTKTQIPVLANKRAYEFSLSYLFGLTGSPNQANPYTGTSDSFDARLVVRLLDTELLPDSIEDVKYRVESSFESYYTVPDSNSITVSRAISPKAENRLKVGREYYLKQGKIRYLNYDEYGSLDTTTPSISIDSTSSGQQKIFTGKSDAFFGGNRILVGNRNNFYHMPFDSEDSRATNNSLLDCRVGAYEYWNVQDNSPLVYPVIKPWEVEQNREYKIAGGANDAVEYNGEPYKAGSSFTGKQLSYNEPLSVDSAMFSAQLSPTNLKEFSARGMRPWMDESAFRPRERGFIELTPLLYRTVSSGSIKAGQKYIAYNSGSFDTDKRVEYPQSSGTFYTAKSAIAHADNFIDVASTATLTGGNWRTKIKQGDKLEEGSSYFVYGGGKIKYISQVEASSTKDDATTDPISVNAIPRSIPKFTVLEFSNGSTFVLSVDASAGDTELSGVLSGKLYSGSVAPITKNKSNKKVTINSVTKVTGDYSISGIDILSLPFNIPTGEVLYFDNGAKLTVTQNALAGDEKIYGQLENQSVSSGNTADIVYEREQLYEEYTANSKFTVSFKGVRGFSYFEITEGEPEVYSATIANNTTVGKGRYYLFGASDQNSTTPSNVFYGVSGQTSFTASTGVTVLQVVGLEEATDNYNAGINENYTVYGNDDDRPLISIYHKDQQGGFYFSKKNGEQFSINDSDGSNNLWDSDFNSFVKYKDATGVQLPCGPVVYTQTQKIIEAGERYVLESLGDGVGVVKYVEMGGTCKKADSASITSINNAADCLTKEIMRYKHSEGATEGEVAKEPGDYSTAGLDFELKITNLDFYSAGADVNGTTSSDVSFTDSNGNKVSGPFNFTLKKYLVCKQGQPITFENGSIFIPSEDTYIFGKYILQNQAHPVSSDYIDLFEVSPQSKNACLTLGGNWVQDETGDYVCQSPNSTTTITNKYILDKEWMPLTVKGQLIEPQPLGHFDEAPLLLWADDIKTAYFTTDGSQYSSSVKKVTNGQIGAGTYTVAGGNEISYNGEIKKIGDTFTGLANVKSWVPTRDSNGSEYVTTAGSNSKFVGLANYEEIEVVSGNPIIFKEGRSFIKPELNSDGEKVLVEGGPIKIVDGLGDLASLDYSEDCLNKLTPEISEKKNASPSSYSPGSFTANAAGSYFINPKDWSSDTWLYESEKGIRSAKLSSAFDDTYDGHGVDDINGFFTHLYAPSYKSETGGSSFLEAGVAECENYIDLDLEYDATVSNGANGILLYQGFKKPYMPKSKILFPEIEPFGGHLSSQSSTTDSKYSDLVDIFADNVVADSDAFVFGRGEINLYNLSDDTLFSTQKIKAHSNLSTSSPYEEGEVTNSGLKKSYRYVVTSGSVTLPIVSVEIKNDYHSIKFEADNPETDQADFGAKGLDKFENSLSNGIKFTQIGYRSVPNTSSLTFTSTITVSAASGDTLTVSPLPVNLEAGEVIENESDSNSYITITERATRGATSVKGTRTGSETVFKRVVTLSKFSGNDYLIEGSKIEGTLSPNHNRNKITSITAGQVADQKTGADWQATFSEGKRFAAIRDFDSSELNGATFRYSNVIPKSIFAGDGTYEASDRQDEKMQHPKVEYTIGDPKILFNISYANNEILSNNYFIDNTRENGIDSSEDKITPDQFTRHYLYDTNYSSATLASIEIDSVTVTAKNNFFIHDGGTMAPIGHSNLKIKSSSQPQNLNSEVYVYKEVISGEIKSGRKYLVYGTGSIEYEGTTIYAGTEFEVTSEQEEFVGNFFIGASTSEFVTYPYYETYWQPNNTGDDVGDGSFNASDLPDINKRQRRVSAPRIYELVYSKDYDGTSDLSVGDICYVYGEGGVTYRSKNIYATNKYIAVSTQNYDDSDDTPDETNYQIFPESFVYGGRIRKTIGHEYSEEETGIVNPIHGINFFAENKYTNASLQAPVTDIDRSRDIVFYKKVHALDGVQSGKKYYVYSNNLESHPVGSTNAQGVVTGAGAGVDSLSSHRSTITFNNVVYSSRGSTVNKNAAQSGELTFISNASSSATEYSAGALKSNVLRLLRAATVKKAGVFGGVEVETCVNCDLDDGQIIQEQDGVIMDTDRKSIVIDGTNITTVDMAPAGHTYVVKGEGYILYPIKENGSNIEYSEDTYTINNDAKSLMKYISSGNKRRLTRRIPAGEAFTPVMIDGNYQEYFVKGTGSETVYKVPKQKARPEAWRGLDSFRGIAPERLGTTEIKAGITYRVLAYQVPSQFSNKTQAIEEQLQGLFHMRGEEGDTVPIALKNYGIKYGGVTYNVGRTFLGVKEYTSWIPALNGNPMPLPVTVREESGTYGNAPQQNWSNQWSMFMTSINSGPDNNLSSLWHDAVYGDVLGFLHNRCHLHSLDFQSNRYAHLLQTFAYGIKPVKRSEAPPGYTYLEGSNSKQNWFSIVWATDDGDATLQDNLNAWFFSSCKIYKPDYIVDTVKCVDVGQITRGFRLAQDTSQKHDRFQSGICYKSGTGVTDAQDQDACFEDEGAWVRVRDRVEVTLNRRLSHIPNTYKPKENVSLMSLPKLKRIHKRLTAGIYGPEPYRTDENALIEYLIKQRKWVYKGKAKAPNDEPYFVSLQCHKARIGDAAPDINVWFDPDDPWGACAPRFYFTKLVPYAFDDSTDGANEDRKTAVSLKQFQQMELYLRGISGGFIDQESDPQPLEYGNVEPGLLPRSVPVCVMSKDYDYLFENLAFQALDEKEDDESSINYKTVEIHHDESALSISRERTYKIRRNIPLEGISSGNYLIFRQGDEFKVNGKLVSISYTPLTSQASTYVDIYEQTVKDRGTIKKYNIPLNQSYTIYRPDKTFFTYTAGVKDTEILEDSQSQAVITWPTRKRSNYALERRISHIPNASEWQESSTIDDFDATTAFGAAYEATGHVKTFYDNLALTEFQKVEYRIRVFYKETIAAGSRILEATSSNSLVSSPIYVNSTLSNAEDGYEAAGTSVNINGQSYKIAILTQAFDNEGSSEFAIQLRHWPSLWLGNSRAITLDGQPRLFYRVEYRVHTSYPDGVNQEEKWQTLARFDNSKGTSIKYTDTNDYSNKNVTYRVSSTQTRSGGLRWISPMFRNDKMGRPDDPKGYGPLQNIKLRAAIFNQFVNAINLLKEVRIDLPITIRHKESVKEWVSKVRKLSNDENSDVLLCGGDYGDAEFVGNASFNDDSSFYREGLPRFGFYAHHEMMSACPKLLTQIFLAEYKLDKSYTSAMDIYVGLWESDEYVESGYFGVCANKDFGYIGRPWIDAGSSAWSALYYQDQKIKLRIPKNQTAMKWAVPFFLRDMLDGEEVVISGLVEDHNIDSQWTASNKGYWEVRESEGLGKAEDMVFCRDINDEGFNVDAVYGFLEPGTEQQQWWHQKRNETYKSWCTKVRGAKTFSAPALRSSDTGLIGLPGGNISSWGTKHMCPKGGSTSSQCFSTRASTGDNNMTLKIPVLDFIGPKPFSSAYGPNLPEGSNKSMTNHLTKIALTNIFKASFLDNAKK